MRKTRLEQALVQVARALGYLASVGLVHRDEAARNVVVGAQVSPSRPAKLSDVGLSRYPHADDDCRPLAPRDDQAAPVPLRWLAVRGAVRRPLLGGERRVVVRRAAVGGVLPTGDGAAVRGADRPPADRRDALPPRGAPGDRRLSADCPPSVYALLAECWKKDASVRRPRFGTVLDRLLGGRRRDPDSSPAGGSSDGTGVAVLASAAAAAASDSPRLGGTSSLPEPPGGRAARPRRRSGGPFSPAGGR